MMRFYNKAAMIGALEETLTRLPSKMLTLTSRLLARAYGMIPLVGAIASTQAETAGIIAEIGENLSSKVENTAYMYYTLAGLNRHTDIRPLLLSERMKQVEGEGEKSLTQNVSPIKPSTT